MQAKARSLVMGMIFRMDVPRIAVFFNSLRATGYDGDIVIFAANISQEMKQFLRAHGVTLVFKNFHGVNRHTLASMRYGFYRDYLALHRDKYDFVMLSDIRDVCFQSDPFSDLTDARVQYFMESDKIAINAEHYNWKWANELFPPEVREIMGPHRIICSGVIIAGVHELCGYLDSFHKHYRLLPEKIRRRMGGGDQSLHQYIALVTKDADGVLVENNQRVATMGTEPRDCYVMASSGRVETQAGAAPPVLHQYDRHEDIRLSLEAAYGARDRQTRARGHWASIPAALRFRMRPKMLPSQNSRP